MAIIHRLSPLRRFWQTYRQVLSIAYQVNSGLLIMVTVINSFWGLTNLPALYINKLLIDIVVNNIGKSDWVDPIKNILLILFVRFIIDLSRSVLSRINMAYSDQLTSQINDHVEKILAENADVGYPSCNNK